MDATSVHAETAPRSRRIAHRALLLVAASVAIACGHAPDTLRPPPTDTTTGVQSVPPFAPPSRAAIIYNETTQLYDACASRFVLFENSTFQMELGCVRRGLRIFGGHYARADTAITFEFGGWDPTITSRRMDAYVTGDTIRVVYGDSEDLESFVDGLYVRQR